jgi:3-demethoxyubiquinol 3-hydroxylase
MRRNASGTDRLLAAVGRAMATVSAVPGASRPIPGPSGPAGGVGLDERQRRLSGALMRVNHVGEVCAQALYDAQAATTRDPALQRFYRDAAAEEGDHLAWTRRRLEELGASPSLLNPLWYAGAFALGAIAGRLGDRVSLGFMVETERQVEQHLASHLERLPVEDHASRAIVDQMKRDEAGHADAARRMGAVEMPAPVKLGMRTAARVMTTTAHYI